MNSNWIYLRVAKPIDFIIRCNNIIGRRQKELENIKDLHALYNKPIGEITYNDDYSKYPIEKHQWTLSEKEKGIEHVVKLHEMLDKIIDWKFKFEDDYDGFKDFIFDSLKYIDDNKLTYIMGENIMYPRSVSDKVTKKYYCYVIGQNGYNKFKEYYTSIVCSDNIDDLVDDITNLLITISDIYNELVSKNIESAKVLLQDYLDDNVFFKCLDIYYLKIFDKLKQFSYQFDDMTNTELIQYLKDIIVSENYKYSKQFLLYENVMIDEQSLEETDYIEI